MRQAYKLAHRKARLDWAEHNRAKCKAHGFAAPLPSDRHTRSEYSREVAYFMALLTIAPKCPRCSRVKWASDARRNVKIDRNELIFARHMWANVGDWPMHTCGGRHA